MLIRRILPDFLTAFLVFALGFVFDFDAVRRRFTVPPSRPPGAPASPPPRLDDDDEEDD